MYRHSLVFLTLASGILLAPMARAQNELLLGTTTSTYDSGLLDTLVPLYQRTTGVRVKVIAVGTGAALEMARRGDVDAVLVHAPEREREYIAGGDLVGGRLIMYNDFLVVGPPGDPAGARRCDTIECALRAISRGHLFISRGDRSGTHERELQLWRVAGLSPDRVRRVETGQGMGATLDIAAQRGAYTLTDRGTYLSHPAARQLSVIREGDRALFNLYHAYAVNPGRHPRVRGAQARAFVEFLASAPAQRAIGEFGRSRYSRSLFVPAAGQTE